VTRVPADTLYDDPELAEFYDCENPWGPDLEYCRTLAGAAASVLDLGCGTGLFAATVAEGGLRRVVGVDPAAAMLAIAGNRSGGSHVEWVIGDARNLGLAERFDLIVLTGHAMQVVLTAADRLAVLKTIASHLSPVGRFAFDSRNPGAGPWARWTPERSHRVVAHPKLGDVTAWNDVSQDPETGVVTYGTFYALQDGRVLSARSKIAFPSREELRAEIVAAGLGVDLWLGDWAGTPYGPDAPEIIPVGRLLV
jgi:SAM-dependent methyltransferase